MDFFLHYIGIPLRAEAPQGDKIHKSLAKSIQNHCLPIDFPNADIHIEGVLDDFRCDDLPASGMGYHAVFQEKELITKGQRLV